MARYWLAQGVAIVSLLGSVAVAGSVSSQKPKPVASIKKQSKEKALVWHFERADIRVVTDAVAHMMKRTILLSPDVHGTITLVTENPLPISELFKAYLSELASLHYALVDLGPNLQKVLPSSQAKQYAVPLSSKQGQGVVTDVVPLSRVKAYALVPTLRPLLDEWGSLSAISSSNALLITGSRHAVQTVKRLALAMDEQETAQTDLVACQYADASQVAQVIRSMMEKAGTKGEYNGVTITVDSDSNTVILHGKKKILPAVKRLVKQLDLLKANGMPASEVIPLSYLKAGDVAPLLMTMMTGKSKGDPKTTSKNGKTHLMITAEPSNNALLVHAARHDMLTVHRLVKELDVRPDQVLIEALVVQIDQTDIAHLGFEWQWGIGSALSTALTNGIGFIKSGSLANILHALKSQGSADILATPSIMVLNNNKATISSGKNIPITSGNYTSTNTSSSSSSPYVQDGVYNQVDRKDVTLTLDVTPQITPEKAVRLTIKQTDDSLGSANDDTSATDLNPTIYTNNINTSVLVNSGDVLVLGGLSSHELRKKIEKLPILGDIPLLGQLFKYHSKDSEKRDLMVFIRPIIIENKADGVSVSKKAYEAIKKQEALMHSHLSLEDQAKQEDKSVWKQFPKPHLTKGAGSE